MTEVVVGVMVLGVLSSCLVSAQAPPSGPYRNFIGDWSGTVEINPEDMPPTLTLHITEDVKKHRMRWDYVFGKPGEKGYAKDTKWIEFKPSKEEMVTEWKGQHEDDFKTTTLNDFAFYGFGVIIAAERGGLNRCIYNLQPTTLDYLWQTSEEGRLRFYSRFHFIRDSSVSNH